MIINDLIGKPFKNGGRGPGEYDCYGLCREVYHRLGIELPQYVIDCYNIPEINGAFNQSKVIRVDKPEQYCIMAIRNNSHVVNHFAIYLGNHEFIHALPNIGVCQASIDDLRWKRAIVGYYRWMG